MATLLLSTLVTSFRTRIGDEGEYRVGCVPLGTVNATNTVFFIPLVPCSSTIDLYNNDVLVDTSAYTIDSDTGKLTYTTAPALSTVHYANLTVYDYADTRIVNFLKGGIRELQSVWDEDWTYAGSGTTETIDPAPTEDEKELILIAADLMYSRAEYNKVLRTPVPIVTGRLFQSTRELITAWETRIKGLEASLTAKARDLGLVVAASGKTPQGSIQWETDPWID